MIRLPFASDYAVCSEVAYMYRPFDRRAGRGLVGDYARAFGLISGEIRWDHSGHQTLGARRPRSLTVGATREG
jgi:hypothetical protein